METREELLSGMIEAEALIKKLASIQQQLTQVRSQYRQEKPLKKMGKIGKIICGILLFYMIAICVTGGFRMLISGVIEVAIAYVVIKFYYKHKNEKIKNINQEIATTNANAQLREQEIINELRDVQITYAERISPWYPENYCTVDAVEFFCHAFRNNRVDTIKEAVNLYEDVMHKQRIEAGQQQQIKQQKLNNMLAVGSIVMQGAQISAINNQTQAVTEGLRKNNEVGNKIADSLKKISDPWW